MKHIFTILGLAALLIVTLIFRNVAAQSPQTQPAQSGANGGLTMTITPQAQNNPANSVPTGWGMGWWGRMMGNEQREAGFEMAEGHTSIMANEGYSLEHGTRPASATPMADDIARYLSMTTQDLYNQMVSGKSLVQIAAEKGVTEQQLMDSIMAGQRAAFDQAVKEGRMTQIYADTMLQNINSDLKIMVNGQGKGSSGWDMMWDTQSSPGFGPFGMHH